MTNDKVDLVVVSLDPDYPQASINAMLVGLRSSRVIDATKLMAPIAQELTIELARSRPRRRKVRKVTHRVNELLGRVLTEAAKRPTKQLVVLVPLCLRCNELATRISLIMPADSVVCTGSD